MVAIWSLSITVFHMTRLASNSVALVYWLDQGWPDDPGWTNQPFPWGFRIWIMRAHSCFLFLSLLASLGLRPRKETGSWAEENEGTKCSEHGRGKSYKGGCRKYLWLGPQSLPKDRPALAWHAYTGESRLGAAWSPWGHCPLLLHIVPGCRIRNLQAAFVVLQTLSHSATGSCPFNFM